MYATKTVPPAHGSEGVIGSLLGWMAETRAFVIGNGSFLIAGPLIATLAGSRTDAQVQVSGLTEALLTLGIPEKEAKRYRGRINDGGILLSVHCDGPDWINKAKDSLLSTGAEDICFMNESTAD